MTGFTQIADGLSILLTLERIRSGLDSGVEVHWEELSPYVIDRARVKIFPLAKASGSPEAQARLLQVKSVLQRDCIHFFGGDFIHAETALDADEGYGRKLARTGAVDRTYAWRVRDYAAVLVRTVDPQQSTTMLALHILPPEWIWPKFPHPDANREQSRRSRIARQRDAADIDWSWPEIADTNSGEGSEQ
ncbi:hypothetical protein GCM10027421_10380 [Microbacterium shaanxiense]